MSRPDPQRLTVLTDLRQEAGLTLAQMALRCGLRGKQSYQTAGAWEHGVYIPSEGRRKQILGYLWDDLRLRLRPQQFEEIWMILVEEWGWEAISDEEWQSFTTQARPSKMDAIGVRTPYQAPSIPPSFVGRKDEMIELHAHLLDGVAKSVALVGMGGVGKSTMAAQAAAQLRDFFTDGVLWANTRVSDPFDILSSWAIAFDHDFGGLSDVQSRASAMRGLLANKRVLLVLDDVTHSARVRPLLPGHPSCAVLVTTRSEDVAIALGCGVMRLPELELEFSLDLLARLLGEKRLTPERAHAESICVLLHNLPLGVEIVGQLLAARPRRTLADMVTRLQDAQGRLDLGIADRDVRASLMVSWEELEETYQRAFANMTIFEGRSFTAKTLAGVMEMPESTVIDQLESLAARSLVSFAEGNRYRQHPLLADFAGEQSEGQTQIWMQFAKYELDFAAKAADDYECLEPEWDNVMAGMKAAADLEHWDIVLDYADVLAGPWLYTSQHGRARSIYPAVCSAAEATGNQLALAVNLNRWAGSCIEQGDFDEAQRKLELGLSLAGPLEAPKVIIEASYNLARVF